ncbi:MAG: PKD domain-containing protein [Chitinophagales bacterium]
MLSLLKKSILCIILYLSCIFPVSSQNFSTLGDRFWLGFMENYSGPTLYVYISSDVNTTGTISIPLQGWTQNFNVTAGTTTEIQVPTGQGQTIGSGIFPNGILVETEENVAVFALNYEGYTSDATVVAPVNTLGNHYYVMAYKDNQTFSSSSEFLIVAAYDNTTIEIVPSVNTLNGNAANVPFQVTLNAGQVYQVQSNGDLSGSLVTSFDSGDGCKDFALFAGNICTGVICPYCDHLNEQMFPTSTWGMTYVLPPLLTRANDRYRVQASVNGTQISINGGAAINLNAGQHHQFNTGQATVVTSNNPISVYQFSMGSDCDGTNSDPFTINLSPVEQTLKVITFNAFTSNVITNYYLNVVTTTANTNLATLDGNNIGGQFTPFPSNPTYSYARLNITQGNHTLASDSGVVGYVYGYGNDESYGYSAGANLSDLRALIRYQVGEYTEQDSIVFICPGDTINFIGEGDSSIISWEWFMGDSLNTYYTEDTISHVYDDYGIYEVKLIVERLNMCSKDTVTQVMEVTGPRVHIVEQDSFCYGAGININVSGGETYEWSTGDTTDNIFVNPENDTLYWVYAIDSLCPGMPDTVHISVVNTATDFYQAPVCPGEVTSFTDLSILGNDTISNWYWDFGNNNTDTVQNPTFTFDSNGVYPIKLVIESGIGCKDSIEKTLDYNPLPIAAMQLDSACRNEDLVFLDSSRVDSGSIIAWQWDLGDNTISTDQNPVYSYDSAGYFDIQLVVWTDSACTDTAFGQLRIYELPDAGFYADPVCFGLESIFTDTSSSNDGTLDYWQWSFGDGDTLTGQQQQHLYDSAGIYNVQLIVNNSFLCADTILQQVEVFARPDADFNASDVCLNDSTVFNSLSSIDIGTLANCTYNLGDGNSSNDCDFSYAYLSPDIYDVELITVSDSGCADTTVKAVEVFHLPEAAFGFDDHCFNDTTQFSDSSQIQSGSILDWYWEFGDNSTSISSSPDHFYAAPDTYSVNLVVSSNHLCTDTATEEIVIFPLPVADFEVDPVCFGDTSIFNNLSSISSGSIIANEWDFSEGNASSQSDPNHNFTEHGTYPVTLQIESDQGCRDTISKDAVVYSLPDVNFTFNNVCLEDSAFFINESAVEDGQIISYEWDNSGMHFSSQTDYSYLFPDSGLYNIKLRAQSSFGCVDSSEADIEIYPLPKFSHYIEPACFGENDGEIIIIPKGGTFPYEINWTDGENIFVREELYSGTYSFTISDKYSCATDSSLYVDQPDHPVILQVEPDSTEIIFGTEVELYVSGNYDPHLNYEWLNPVRLTCSDCQDPVADPLEYILYTVEATDTQGCKGIAKAEVFVKFDYIFFAPTAFTPNGDGNNDTFKVYARGVKNIELNIFNRWGELLFETHDIENGWNGLYRGELLNPDVFVYHVVIEYLNGYKKSHRGSFTLIR